MINIIIYYNHASIPASGLKVGSFAKYYLRSFSVSLVNGLPFPTIDISIDLSFTSPYYEADFAIADKAWRIKLSWSARGSLSMCVSR